MRRYKVAIATLGLWFAAAPGMALIIGPTGGSGADGEYSQASDSPFAGDDFSNGYFFLEDMEDQSLVAGLTASDGDFVSINFGPNVHDSVDADDGVIDGSGLQGESWFSGFGNSGVSFLFDATILGALPTHAGLVWTDGAGAISFEAFDAVGNSLGTASGNHADFSVSGTTSDDRFYGAENAGGISRIFIRNDFGGIEIDHVQFGQALAVNPPPPPPPPPAGNVPEPGTLPLIGLGLLGLMAIRRRYALR